MKITYLINNVYGIGGTIRTVLNQAGALADRGHDVEVASVFQHRDEPALQVPPGVGISPLVDLRAQATDSRAQRPSTLYPHEEKLYERHSELSDTLVAKHLTERAADVVVGTRAGLNILLARLRDVDSPISALVGQEHLTYGMYGPRLRAAMERAYRRLDAVTPVTDADAQSYRTRMRLPGVRVTAIPNCVPQPPLSAAGPDRHTILAAGRLTGMKGYDLLLDAFAQVCGDHPDWTLRIFGRGRDMQSRKHQIAALGLHDRAFMMGPHPRIEEAWPLGSFCAMTSRDEPFGMTIVEAMRAGLPVVATNCPHGPAEIINDGTDGLLVTNRDTDAIARGLDRMMSDDALRKDMAAAAIAASQRYSPDAVARRHEELFRELVSPTSMSPMSRQPSSVTSPPPEPDTEEDNPRPAPSRCDVAVRGDGTAHITLPAGLGQIVLRSATGEQDIALDGDGVAIVAADSLPTGTTEWEVLHRDGDNPRPLRPDLIDLRHAPDSSTEVKRLSLVEPYRDEEGALRLTVRHDAHHAEVSEVAVTAESATVTGTVLGGTAPDHDAVLVLRARGEEKAEAELPCAVSATGWFSATVPTSLPTRQARDIIARTGGNHDGAVIWDLRLRCHGREHRIGRCLLGHGDWKSVVTYPAAIHTDGTSSIRMRPYFTVKGHLALKTIPVSDSATIEEEAVIQLTDSGRRLQVAGLIRAAGADGSALTLRAVDRTGAAVPIPLHTEPGPRGLAFTGTASFTRGGEKPRLPFGTWRLVLSMSSSNGPATEVTLSTPATFQRQRWWRGLRPVYTKVTPGPRDKKQGPEPPTANSQRPAIVEHAPIRVIAALRRRFL